MKKSTKPTKVTLPKYTPKEFKEALYNCLDAFKYVKPDAVGKYLTWHHYHHGAALHYTSTSPLSRIIVIAGGALKPRAFGKPTAEAVIRLNNFRPVRNYTFAQLEALSPKELRKVHKEQAPLSTYDFKRKDIFPKGYYSN
jgi:hypothetical protein